MKAALLALCLMAWAPYQCATEPDQRPQEDSAPKALWMLAEKFEQEGNSSARETTLQQLIEQYPSSRYAERARANMGLPARGAERSTGAEEHAQKTRDEAETSAAQAGKTKPADAENGDE